MANQFLGLAVLVALSDGTAVEGTLSDIDVQNGTLRLTAALVHQDDRESIPVHSHIVQRSQVKDIQVLSLQPALNQNQNNNGHPPEGQARNDRTIADANHISDPAILSVGRKAPASTSSVSSHASRIHASNQALSGNNGNGAGFASFAPHVSSGPASVRPAPSSLASNSTIGAASVLSAPPAAGAHQASGAHPQRPHVQRDKSSSQRINIHKKKGQQVQHYNLNSIPRKFGGAETAGSEADESHVANSEAPMVRRKVTNSSLRPKQQYMTSLQPDDTEAGETSDNQSVDSPHPSGGLGILEDEFDFQSGLAAFNKQAVFNEIREADRTDPLNRLVAHNKRSKSPNRFTTKLRYDEPVLDANETDDAPETHRYAGYYASNEESASLMPHDSITEGLGGGHTDNETANSDDGGPQRLRNTSASHPASYSTNGLGRSVGPASAMLASAAAKGQHSAQNKKHVTTKEGILCPTVSDKVWKEVHQLCNIESGPNLVQRCENGARGIASVVFREAGKVRQGDPQPSVVILCTPCMKGGQGLRAGAHLVNHGASVTAFLPQSDNAFPANFDFYLRLFSSSGGKVARSADDLPESADIIVDALTENEPASASTNRKVKYDSPIQEVVSWALSCSPAGRMSSTPIISVDLPSNTDPDTGAVIPGAIWSITPTAIVALGLVRAPAANARCQIYLVDTGLPSSAIERAGVKDYVRPFVGDTWITTIV